MSHRTHSHDIRSNSQNIDATTAGIRQSTMRDSLGHSSLATTGIYVNDDLIERKREMEKLFPVG